MDGRENIERRIGVRDSSGPEHDKYQCIIKEISQHLSNELYKNKRLLFITGAGISSEKKSENTSNKSDDKEKQDAQNKSSESDTWAELNVPGTEDILNRIETLVERYPERECFSQEFKEIFEEYKESKNRKDNKQESQSKLLTYIQNAYMQKEDYVQETDLEHLQKIWTNFVHDLLDCITQAKPTAIHESIADLMIEINEGGRNRNTKNQAVALTTNFDNLLQKCFANRGKNFYPLLDRKALDQYYTSAENDNSHIEIQSRGDVFWVECSGEKNRTCEYRRKRILLPNIDPSITTNITCPLCGSKALIYFAFPGTKEKDAEMATMVDGLWKYISTSISTIIIVGSSLDYDPVLIEFIRELAKRYAIKIVYISRYKDNGEPQIREKIIPRINDKKATDFLFGSNAVSDSYWLQAVDTSLILNDIFREYKNSCRPNSELINKTKNKTIRKSCLGIITRLFSEDCNEEKLEESEMDTINLFRLSIEKDNQNTGAEESEETSVFEIPELMQLRQYSQLGMKTYWLCKNKDISSYKLHTRYKHSLGVMLIASYIYLNKVDKPSWNELTFLQLAALLHDIGHLPYSHLMEEVFNEFGWKLSSTDKSYSHEQNSKQLLVKIYNDEHNSTLKELLDRIGYTCEDLQRLISGEFGVGYLDALINSPIDCDKIEYLFTDTIYTRNDTRYKIDEFLKDFVCDDLKINCTGCFLISGKSTRAFLKLINMRGDMYENTYYRSGLRYLESCTKLIIRTFLSYYCNEESKLSAAANKSDYPCFKDLSECKIRTTIAYLEDTIAGKSKDVSEIAIIQKMYSDIEKRYCNSEKSYSIISIKPCLDYCIDAIVKTKYNELSNIETTRIRIFEVNSSIDKAQLRGIIKNLYLRFPGVVLIDLIESKSSFSFGRRDTGILRSDGTTSPYENILIKDIKQVKGYTDKKYICIGDAVKQVNSELKYPTHSYIYLHRITDNRFSYMQAEDYIIDEFRKGGIIDVK